MPFPDFILFHPKLSFGAKVMWATLARYSDDDFLKKNASIRWLAEKTHCQKREANKRLAELEREGLIKKIPRDGRVNHYKVSVDFVVDTPTPAQTNSPAQIDRPVQVEQAPPVQSGQNPPVQGEQVYTRETNTREVIQDNEGAPSSRTTQHISFRSKKIPIQNKCSLSSSPLKRIYSVYREAFAAFYGIMPLQQPSFGKLGKLLQPCIEEMGEMALADMVIHYVGMEDYVDRKTGDLIRDPFLASSCFPLEFLHSNINRIQVYMTDVKELETTFEAIEKRVSDFLAERGLLSEEPPV